MYSVINTHLSILEQGERVNNIYVHIVFSVDPVGVGVPLVCSLSPYWMDRFWPNLHKYIIGTGKNAD